jgi:hypothetical protein
MNSFLDALSKAFINNFLFTSEDYFDINLLRHVSRGKVGFDRLCLSSLQVSRFTTAFAFLLSSGIFWFTPDYREKGI